MQGKRNSTFLIRANLVVPLLILLGCTANQPVAEQLTTIVNVPTEQPVCQPTDWPRFLHTVWPKPGTHMNLESYRESLESFGPVGVGVGVAVWANEVDSPLIEPSEASIPLRTSLYIDGEFVVEEVEKVSHGLMEPYVEIRDEEGNLLFAGKVDAGPYYIKWIPDLAPGYHEASTEVISNSDEILEYTWCFILTDE